MKERKSSTESFSALEEEIELNNKNNSLETGYEINQINIESITNSIQTVNSLSNENHFQSINFSSSIDEDGISRKKAMSSESEEDIETSIYELSELSDISENSDLSDLSNQVLSPQKNLQSINDIITHLEYDENIRNKLNLVNALIKEIYEDVSSIPHLRSSIEKLNFGKSYIYNQKFNGNEQISDSDSDSLSIEEEIDKIKENIWNDLENNMKNDSPNLSNTSNLSNYQKHKKHTKKNSKRNNIKNLFTITNEDNIHANSNSNKDGIIPKLQMIKENNFFQTKTQSARRSPKKMDKSLLALSTNALIKRPGTSYELQSARLSSARDLNRKNIFPLDSARSTQSSARSSNQNSARKHKTRLSSKEIQAKSTRFQTELEQRQNRRRESRNIEVNIHEIFSKKLPKSTISNSMTRDTTFGNGTGFTFSEWTY